MMTSKKRKERRASEDGDVETSKGGKAGKRGKAGRAGTGSEAEEGGKTDEARSDDGKPSIPPNRLRSAVAWGLVGLLTAVLAVNSLLAYRFRDDLRPVHAGQMARDFDLPTLSGDRVRLSDLRGRVVLMIFWSIYCGVCHKELGVLNRVRKAFEGKDVTILAVHAGNASKVDVEDMAVNKLELKMPVLLDDGRAANLYRVRQFPQLVLVGRKGRVLKVWSGYTPRSALAGAIRQALRRH